MSSIVASLSEIELQVECSCSRVKPLDFLLYCKQCGQLKCSQCVSHEILFRYCPSCLNTVLKSQASSHGNRCQQCFECPRCIQSILNPIRVSSGMLCLGCSQCGFNLKGQVERSSLGELLQALQEGSDDDVRDFNSRRVELRDRFQMPNMTSLQVSRKQGGMNSLADKFNPFVRGHLTSTEEGEESTTVATPEAKLKYVEPLSIDTSAAIRKAEKLSTLAERRAHPATQENVRPNWSPRGRQLLARTIQACNACEQVLCKPSTNARNATFDTNLIAFDFLPFMLVSSHKSSPRSLHIQFINPAEYPVRLLLSLDTCMIDSKQLAVTSVRPAASCDIAPQTLPLDGCDMKKQDDDMWQRVTLSFAINDSETELNKITAVLNVTLQGDADAGSLIKFKAVMGAPELQYKVHIHASWQ